MERSDRWVDSGAVEEGRGSDTEEESCCFEGGAKETPEKRNGSKEGRFW